MRGWMSWVIGCRHSDTCLPFWMAILVICLGGSCLAAPDGQTGPMAGTTAERSPGYQPQVAVQLYVWIQDRGRRQIDFWDDLDNVLAEVKATGAKAIEGWLDWCDTDERADRAEGLLKKHGLRVIGLYAGGVLHEQAAAEATIASILARAERAKKRFGRIYIDVNPNPLPGKARKSDAQLATQVKMLDRLGRGLADRGLYLVIHQHDPEILHEAREHRYNVSHTDPRYVGFCLDTHWVYRGGQDPLALLKEAGRRVKALHLRNSENGVWTESFGPGDVDYAAIAKQLREIGFDGWLVVELAYEPKTKITRPLTDDVRLSLAYVNSVFLGDVGPGGAK